MESRYRRNNDNTYSRERRNNHMLAIFAVVVAIVTGYIILNLPGFSDTYQTLVRQDKQGDSVSCPQLAGLYNRVYTPYVTPNRYGNIPVINPNTDKKLHFLMSGHSFQQCTDTQMAWENRLCGIYLETMGKILKNPYKRTLPENQVAKWAVEKCPNINDYLN